MKAGWTSSDYSRMRVKPMPFASVDVELIQLGLAARDRRPSATLMASNAQ
jgi:hypothetical protein